MSPCCHDCTPERNSTCRKVVFILIVFLELIDLVSDWLVYADFSKMEKGLVFGPPEDAVIHALLTFSIIGSFTFVLEGINLWWGMFRGNPWLDTDFVSAVTIWIEDLPQISINVYLAHCREDPSSGFQLFKASVVLIDLAIRIIISSARYCNKAAIHEECKTASKCRRRVAYRVFIMLGLLINSACAITVFIFTQTQHDLNGDVKFQVPQTIIEDKYNDQRYFQNVSVFVHNLDFDVSTPSNPSTGSEANWVRFMSITDIMDQKDPIRFNYVYERTATELKMALYKNKQGTWHVLQCYRVDKGAGTVTTVDKNTCQSSFFSSRAFKFFVTFSFTPHSFFFRKLIFGDIKFNIKQLLPDGTCTDFKNFVDNDGKPLALPTIHYYRTNGKFSANDTNHMLMDNGQPRFYRSDGVDLQDITEVWKTGWGRCESSGSLAPNLDREIPTECSN